MASATVVGLNKHYAAIFGCAVAFTTAAAVTFGMRMLSKIITRAPFVWEDYIIAFGAALYIVTQGLLLKATMVGRHSKVLNDPDDQLMSKYMYIYSIFYFSVIAASIVSILLLYRRVFIKTFMKHATTVLLIITICWWIPCTTIEVGYFSPYPERWPGEPANTNPFGVSYLNWWLAVGVIEQVIIVVAIMLPVREIYFLHMDLQKRLSLMLIFAISYICVGTGIARLAAIYRPNDKNFDTSLGDIWLSTHLGTAIMSANLPVCWPIIQRIKRMLGLTHPSEEKWEAQAAGIEAARSPDDRRISETGRLDSPREESVTASVIESFTLGHTTKDGTPRNGSYVLGMESDANDVSPSPSEAAILPIKEEQATRRDESPNRKRSRWLELRPFNWQITWSSSKFGSQASTRG